MGGLDKGLQQLHGKSMVQHVIDRLMPQVSTMLISANEHAVNYTAFGFPVVPDLTPDHAGPLAGLEAGLTHCKTAYLFSAPCDSPFLPTDIVNRLAEALSLQNADVAFACTVSSSAASAHVAANTDPNTNTATATTTATATATNISAKRQRQPVFCLMSVKHVTALQTYMQSGGRKMDGWTSSLRVVDVLFSDEHAFRNINTKAELKSYFTL